MRMMGLFEVKNRFSEVCDEVMRTGGPCIVTRRGKPLVKIIPIEEEQESLWSTVEESQAKYGKIKEELELPERRVSDNRPFEL